jgi:hypothetical protein
MSQGKLNVFVCLFILQCNRQINTFSLLCDMILSYNVIDKQIHSVYLIMSQGKLNEFIFLLHYKIESCHKVN